MKGLPSTSVTSLLHKIRSKPRPTASARERAADLRHGPEPEIVDQWGSVSRGRIKALALRLIQFLAIMLTALALVPSGTHLAALPNKIAMAQTA